MNAVQQEHPKISIKTLDEIILSRSSGPKLVVSKNVVTEKEVTKKPVKNDKKMPGMGVGSIHQQTEMCQAYHCS